MYFSVESMLAQYMCLYTPGECFVSPCGSFYSVYTRYKLGHSTGGQLARHCLNSFYVYDVLAPVWLARKLIGTADTMGRRLCGDKGTA